MEKTRVTITVELDIDPEDGLLSTAIEAKDRLEYAVQMLLPAYNPKVTLRQEAHAEVYKDQAMLIKSTMVGPGGMFFMKDEYIVGWYVVKSDDPKKQDLILPPHIFKKCFAWDSLGHTEYPNSFNSVKVGS